MGSDKGSGNRYKNVTWHNGVMSVRLHDCIVCSDFHVPGENKTWVKRMLNYAQNHGIKHLIIGGDFWNHDAISEWDLKDPDMNFRIELERGIALLKQLSAKMTVYIVCGNHDARMPKALKYALNFTDWMHTVHSHNVIVTDFDYLHLISGARKFRICHPSMYSRIKGNQVAALAQDLQENVIMGHQHYASMSTNKTGRFICIDAGCMCDKDAFLYKRAQTTKCPEWENCFLHVREGRIRMITEYTF